jgi:hypothetical protein
MAWRHTVRLVLVLLAFAVSLRFAAEAFGFLSPWFGVMVMFCVLGIAAFSQPAWTLRVPGPFRRIQAWESDRRLQSVLGVAAFGRLLTRTPLRALNRSVYFDRQTGDIAGVRAQLEAAEGAHFWSAAVLVPYIGVALFRRSWGAALGLVLANVVVNVYPMLHLRLVRGRIERVGKRLSRDKPQPVA